MKNLDFTSVCAVITTYNAAQDISTALAAILPQTGHVVLVDNGSTDATIGILHALKAQYGEQISIILRQENNLAAAQNQGISHANALGMAWVLLLDDDSIAAPDMVSTLLAAYAAAEKPDSIGLLAPHLKELGTGTFWRYVVPCMGIGFARVSLTTPTLSSALFVIAAGSLIPVEIFDRLGGMDESMNIDYLDVDFCLRLKKAKYHILVVRSAVLEHRVGEKQQHRLGNLTVTTCNHPALRRYTIYRNRIRVWLRYAAYFPSFVLYDFAAALYDTFRILCFEDDKTSKLKALLRGVKDGVANNL